MTMRAVARLIRKDWSLNQGAIALYALAAVAGATLAARPGGMARGLGLTLILNVLIGLSFHLPFGTILGERDRKTLAFALSLPIAPGDYAAAKLFANLLLFCIPAGAAASALGLTTAAEGGRAALLRLLLLGLLAWVELFRAGDGRRPGQRVARLDDGCASGPDLHLRERHAPARTSLACGRGLRG